MANITTTYDTIANPYINPYLQRTNDVVLSTDSNLTDLGDFSNNGDGGSSGGSVSDSNSNGNTQIQSVKSDGAIGDVWIRNFIRSENWKPSTQGFAIDGQTGYAEFHNVHVVGKISALTGEIGGFLIGATNLSSTYGGNTTILSSGFTAFAAGPTGAPTVTITQEGYLTAKRGVIGGFTLADGSMSAGIIKTAVNVGMGDTGVIMDTAGLRGYSGPPNNLGLVFNIPTDGTAPTFASGIINTTIFNVDTSGVIRTSDHVGDGTINSAGILINNTGIYATELSQLLPDANVRILSDGQVFIKGSITITNPGDINTSSLNNDAGWTDDSSLNTFINDVYTSEISSLQNQIDGQITTWFYPYLPTLINVPASDWTTTTDKDNHLGDLFYDTNTGYAYRFQVVTGTYSWQQLSDSDIAAALLVASDAQDTADSKRRVFMSEPTTPYDVGDLWLTSLTDVTGDLKKCVTAAASGAYNAAHWLVATKYTEGATWGTNLSGIPNTLAAPSGKGLFLGSDHLGFYNSDDYPLAPWRTYMDDTGNLILGDIINSNSGLVWNESSGSLDIKGSITLLNTLPVASVTGLAPVATSADFADIGGVTKPADNADVTLSAVESGLRVTGGGITLDAGGALKGGQTDFNTLEGFFLGYSGGDYKFSIGDPAGNYMTWDGVYLKIRGSFDVGVGGLINNSVYTVANLPVSPQTLPVGGGFSSPSAYE